jgi:uncharacterized membrane protein (DUF4010 family)
MVTPETTLLGLAAALGGGLLIGIERERRKGTGPHRRLAGVRTFALAAVTGAAAAALKQPALVAAGALFVLTLVSIDYWRNRSGDPGVTTGMALLVTYLLGVLAPEQPIVCAGGSVVVAVLLASRRTLHAFSVDILTERELRDGLALAAAALILLPLLPDLPMNWAAGANPRRLWGLVVLFMALQAAGYIALRAGGPRFGLALSGLASGFLTSTGTIAALGARARRTPSLLLPCVAGALFSTVATVVLLGVVVVTVCPAAVPRLALSLLAALAVALAAAGFYVWRQRAAAPASPVPGRAFDIGYAVGFALALSAVTAIVSLADRYLGATAVTAATAAAGVFDVHAAASSALSLASGGNIALDDVTIPVLAAVSTNTGSKLVAAFVAGGRSYGMRVGAGVLLTLVAAWTPVLLAARA